MKVLLDTCIVVDLLQKREPFFKKTMQEFPAIQWAGCVKTSLAMPVATPVKDC